MSRWTSRKKTQAKKLMRDLASDFDHRKAALFLPADKLCCVEAATSNGMIAPGSTKLILVERDKNIYKKMQKKASQLGWDDAVCHHGSLEEFKLPCKLDYIWIDLNGTLSEKMLGWIEKELKPKLKKNSIVCLTHEYCWRNNPWIKQKYQEVARQDAEGYSQFRFFYPGIQAHADKYFSFPIYLLVKAFSDRELALVDHERYRDTIDMVFYSLIFGGQDEQAKQSRLQGARNQTKKCLV